LIADVDAPAPGRSHDRRDPIAVLERRIWLP